MTDNTHITKNYMAHGGDELVIGGRLTILPGAVVEGLPSGGAFTPAEAQPDSKATSAATLREDFNALLARLRAAGILSAEAAPATQEAAVTNETPNDTAKGDAD